MERTSQAFKPSSRIRVLVYSTENGCKVDLIKRLIDSKSSAVEKFLTLSRLNVKIRLTDY